MRPISTTGVLDVFLNLLFGNGTSPVVSKWMQNTLAQTIPADNSVMQPVSAKSCDALKAAGYVIATAQMRYVASAGL